MVDRATFHAELGALRAREKAHTPPKMLAGGWRAGVAKEFERRTAAMVQPVAD